jgi:arabinofuranosyltransferase
MSGVFLVTVALLVSMQKGTWRRWVRPALAALALPVIYELWRMAYFAMLVPNTGLAKGAGSTWWSQGLDYLWNFVSPYTLWLPFALSIPFVVVAGRRLDRPHAVVLCAPLVAALVDTVYVVAIGGDYMHARLLLPAFFAGCLVVAFRIERTWLVLPAIGICIWAIVCAGWLRNTELGLNPIILNTRNDTIAATHNSHPVTAADYKQSVLGLLGSALHNLGEEPGQRILYGKFKTTPAHSSIPFHLVAASGTIGVIGYLAGPNVYIFDTESLANPIGSHTTTHLRFRPGHDKPVSTVWMYGRFGTDPAKALSCAPLSSYLHAITAPLTFGQAMSNVFHSFTYTTMRFSPNPTTAWQELCQNAGS